MARIINLDELVPEDVEIRYRGGTYMLPGDVSTETIFKLFELYRTLASGVEDEDPAAVMARLRDRFGDIEAELLSLFRQRQPELEAPPFGLSALGAVLRVILAHLGINIPEGSAPPPPRPPAKRTT